MLGRAADQGVLPGLPCGDPPFIVPAGLPAVAANAAAADASCSMGVGTPAACGGGACGLDEELADAGGIPGGGIPPVSIPWKGDCLAVPVKAPDPWRGILVIAKSCAPSIARVLGSFAFLS